MARIFVFLFLFLLCAIPAYADPQEVVAHDTRYIASLSNEAIEAFQEKYDWAKDYSVQQIKDALYQISNADPENGKKLELINAETVESEELDFQMLSDLLETGLLNYLEPDFAVTTGAVPNDPQYSSLWGMHGSNGISAPDAWDISTGSSDVVVAVIDTGVDYHHQDLAANMWINDQEIAGNGIDDDNNGYIDDVHGINAIKNDGDPDDDHSHGTHCAGTIGGVGNNGIGVVGVAWNVKIMALKFLSASGSGWTSDAVETVLYAVQMRQRGVNVRVLSNSWGGGGYSSSLANAINASESEGMLFIAAAGNSGTNNDVWPHYPSNYSNASVVSVASTTSSGSKSGFSCYGATTVDLGAPGSSIRSTVLNNNYATYSGTSMATPHVAGAAAVLLSHNSSLTTGEIKSALMNTGDGNYGSQWVSGKRLNLHAALESIVPDEPPTLDDIADQVWSAGDTSANVPIVTGDADGDPISCTAVAVGSPDMSFWNFYTQYEPFCRGAPEVCEEGIYAPNTKRLYGKNGELFELHSDNRLYRTDTGTQVLIGTFASAYAQPTLLTAPPAPPINGEVDIDCTPTNLAVSWNAGFSGQFRIDVTVTSNGKSVQKSFNATIQTTPPTLSEIANQTTVPGVVLDLPFTVSSTTNVEVTATIRTHYNHEAFRFDAHNTVHGYYSNLDDSNSLNEKWFYSGLGWIYLVPLTESNDDEYAALFHYSSGALLALYSDIFYENPEMLVSPEQATVPLPTVSVIGQSSLRIDIPNEYKGSFAIDLVAKNEHYTVVTDTDITVMNEYPVVSYTALHNVGASSAGSVNSKFSISDADGHPLTVTVEAFNAGDILVDDVERLGLIINGSLYYNSLGHNEYHLHSTVENRGYILVPQDGACFMRRGSPNGNIHNILPISYCSANNIETKVLNPARSRGGTPTASHTCTGGECTLSIDATDTALTRVMLTVSDGYVNIYRYVFVAVANYAPKIVDISDTVISPDSTAVVPLSIYDPDGDTLTHSVEVDSYGSLAYQLDQSFDLTQVDSCRTKNNCFNSSKGEWFLYSRDRRSVVKLSLQDDFCHLSIGSSNIGTFPAAYCYSAHLLHNAAPASSSVATATLSSTTGDNPTLTVNPNGSNAALVTVTTTDGIETVSSTFNVTVSSAVDSNGQPVIDSDGDGISDAQEAIDGTNPYDKGDARPFIRGSAYGFWMHDAHATTSLHFKNTHESESSIGTAQVFDSSGNLESEYAFTIAAGESAEYAVKEASPDSEETRGYVVVVATGGQLTGYTQLDGDTEINAAKAILRRDVIMGASSGETFIPYHLGRLLGEDYFCDSDICSSELYLQNFGSGDLDFTVELYSPSGESIHVANLTVQTLQTALALDIDDLVDIPLYGLIKITPSNQRVAYQAFVEEIGETSLGDTQYSYAVRSTSGTGEARQVALSNEQTEYSSTASVQNTHSFTVYADIELLSQDAEVLQTRRLTLAPFAREELNFSELIPEGEYAFLTVNAGSSESIILHGEHSSDTYDEEDVGTFQTSLRKLSSTNIAAADSLSHWYELVQRVLNEGEGGSSGSFSAPVGSLAGYSIRVLSEKDGKRWNLLTEVTDPDGQVIGIPSNASVYLFRVKRKGRKNTLVTSSSDGIFNQVRRGAYRYKLMTESDSITSPVHKLKRERKCTQRRKKKGLC